jgi:hypothetical protein
MTEDQNKTDPNTLGMMSEPYWQFSKAHYELMGFIEFVSELATLADESTDIISSSILYQVLKQLKVITDPVSMTAIPVSMTAIVEGYKPLTLQMMLCRAVDNYLTYMKDLLALIFRTRPETLKSSETERLDFVLQYSTMEELISALSEKRVEELSYRSMQDLHNYLDKELGFRLFNKEELDNAVRINLIRNIIVHNRGIVNRIFISKLPANSPANLLKQGEPVKLNEADVKDDIKFLFDSASDIDMRATKKFGLTRTPHKHEPLLPIQN